MMSITRNAQPDVGDEKSESVRSFDQEVSPAPHTIRAPFSFELAQPRLHAGLVPNGPAGASGKALVQNPGSDAYLGVARRSGLVADKPSLPPGKTPVQARAGNIDSLRAIAMTAVVACHAGIFDIGWMGVWLFFVISGYAVTASVLGRPGSLRQFTIRRLRRIAPIYWAYIAFGLIVIGGQADWRAVLGLVTFTNNLAGIFGGHYLCCGSWRTGHLWTISVEMQFYIIYGALLFWAPRRVTVLTLLAMLALAPLYRLGLAATVPGPGDWRGWLIHAGPLTQADTFAAGSLLALIARYSKVDFRLAGNLLVIALICLMIDLLGRLTNHHLHYVMRAPFEYAAMTWFFAAVCAAALVVPKRFPRLERIGLVSYGAYMLHDMILGAVAETGLPPAAVFALGYPLVIGAAELSYRFFESRFYRFLV